MGAKKLEGVSFIYSIRNRKTGKIYIGSTHRALKVRWLEHKKRLRNNEHKNLALQVDYNATGLGNFIFSLVERTSPEKMEAREQYWRDHFADVEKFPAGVYNTGDDTLTPFKGRAHTPEAREAIRQSVKKTIAGKTQAIRDAAFAEAKQKFDLQDASYQEYLKWKEEHDGQEPPIELLDPDDDPFAEDE